MDGACAAWIAWKIFGKDAEYIPVQYGQPPPEHLCKDHKVLILDFSYKREVLLALKERVGLLEVLDHHKTAQADLEGLDFCIFDVNKSGAMLAWEWFHPHELAPTLVQYVQDHDLWLFSLPYSKQIRSYIQSYDYVPENYESMSIRINTDFNGICNEALAIERYKAKSIELHVKRAANNFMIDSKVGPTLGVNISDVSIISEVCNKLANLTPRKWAYSWFTNKDRQTVYSLRSTEDGPDVSEIAKLYNGGGHKHAAGFVS